MSFKKAASLILATAVAFSFASCGKDAPSETTVAQTTAAETTAAETTAQQTTEAPNTTAEPEEQKEPFEGMFPEDYEIAYPNGFDYSTVDLDSLVTLGDYKGLTLKVTTHETFPEDELEAYIMLYRLQSAVPGDAVDNRPAMLTDICNIDYAGYIDGVQFDNGTAEGQTATLGLGMYIPGFEEGIVGMSIGETKTVDVVFPEDYGNDLAGKAAQFVITLNSITESVLPEYTDEFVKENSEYETKNDFEAALKEEYAAMAYNERGTMAFSVVMELAQINGYSDELVNDYIFSQVTGDKQMAENYGVSYSELVSLGYGMTVSEYEQEVKSLVLDMIKQEMVLFAFAKAEGITVTEAERKAELDAAVEMGGYESLDAMLEEAGVTEELLNYSIDFYLLTEKVVAAIIEYSTFIVAE